MLINLREATFVEGVDKDFITEITHYLYLYQSQNSTNSTSQNQHLQQNEFHGSYFTGKSLASKLQPVFFAAGCIANIIIIIYFLTRYVGKQSRKTTPIPLATSRDHTTIKIVTRRRKMSSYHFLLILLAIADLFCCMILLVASYQHMWQSNKWYCRLGSLIMESCSLFSICSLVLLFYEKYRGIVYHRQEPLRKRKYLLMSIACFLFSWAVYIPEIFEVRLQDKACVLRKSYIKTEFFALFSWYRFIDTLLPTALMSIFRWRISIYIHNVTNNLSGNGGTLRRRTPSDINRRAALRTINWLFGFYTLLIVPWRIVYTVSEYYVYFNNDFVQKHNKIIDLGKCVLILLLFMNNVVNIFVYLVLIPNFRRFVKKIFSCGMVRK